MADIKDLHIFFLTVGETSAKESLEALIKYTPQPYKLTVWYDACGRGVNRDFYEMLCSYSEDVFVLTKNHAIASALGYAMLYLDGDYLMYVPCDCVVNEDYLNRFKVALDTTPKVACVGGARVDGHPDFKFDFDFIENSPFFRPDGIMLFSKEAILEIGSISPSFREYGYDNLEWLERARHFGWNLVACSNISKEINGMHEGREKNPELKNEIATSTDIYLKIRDSHYQNFKWWDHSYRKEPMNV